MNTLNKLSWEILNATVDDCENLEQIYRQICLELIETSDTSETEICGYRPLPDAPFLSEIADRVRNLVDSGWLAAVRDEEGRPLKDLNDLSYVWRAWFSMTAEGTKIWESSQHLAMANNHKFS